MTYHYTESGLDYVYLENGYDIHETAYGSGVSFSDADTLDRVIASYTLSSAARLCGQEVRFLRALLDLSQTELAIKMGIKRLTITRWESKPKTPIPGPADRLLRFIYFMDNATISGYEHNENKAMRELALNSFAMFALSLEDIGSLRREPLHMVYMPKITADSPTLFGDDEEKSGWSLRAA